ncbi:hypothetical protein [Flavobacterium piscinae]|uniref:hypothetical protein n=1 Tax=Flavobacterium piscinae TaxID=2506424 RepID=UPI002AAA9A3F|nr:hypothetical protein [Flavobacterium piscinae]
MCDEALPNDQFTAFDLTIRDNDITNGLGGYTVTYYPSLQNAQNNVNPIQDPTAYTNAVLCGANLRGESDKFGRVYKFYDLDHTSNPKTGTII